MAARSTSRVIVVIASLGALAAVTTAVWLSDRTFDAASWGRLLEGRLREGSAALHARVATLAELPTLAAAVSTDPRTVRDLTQDELAFRPRRGEVVAVGQLPKSGTPVVLLVLPEGAEAPIMTQTAGPVTAISSGTLLLSEAIQVVPRERADELQGIVAASEEIELEDLSRRMAADGIGARLTIAEGRLDLGIRGRITEGGTPRFMVPVDSKTTGPGIQLTLFPPPAPDTVPFWIAGGLLVAVAAVFSASGRLRAQARNAGARGAGAAPEVWTPAAVAVAATTPPAHRPPVAVGAVTPTVSPTGLPNVLIGATGRKIGRYEIVQHIGTGGMADVYLAHATGEAGFTKKIALKVLERSFARQPELVNHFLDEARLASMLDHPNIVQIIDLGHADDEYFIAMEFIDGADLARLIEISARAGRRIPLPVVLAIVRKVCDGLHAAHTTRAGDGALLGLVHRDMKCGNVFVARNGVVKIGDFGIAMTNHASRVTRTQIGLVKGTPGYMAPEHRLGQPIDGRADIYGVGAIAYELLSGISVNLDVTMLAQRGRQGWPHLASLSQFRGDVPAQLEGIIFRALSYDADQRFADCAAMEAALDEVARRYPPVAGDKTIAHWIEATLTLDSPLTLPQQPEPLRGREV
ncbi:MAG: serine/threonine-protein kinase [Myxococcales bacterium]